VENEQIPTHMAEQTDGEFDDTVDDALAGSSVNRIRLLEGSGGVAGDGEGSGMPVVAVMAVRCF
jgi:hypothetical protein